MPRKLLRYAVPLVCLAGLGAVPVLMTSGQVDAQTEAPTEAPTAVQPDPNTGGPEAVHYDIAKIATLFGSARYNVDAAFADRVGRPIPVHFTVSIPEPSDVTSLVNEAQEGAIVKFSFVTKSAEPRLIENLFFVEATVAPAPEGDRLRALGGYLSDKIFAQATEGFEEPKKVAIRRVQVGSFPAAELSGSYIDPALGPVNLRLLAIPDPDSDRAVIVVNNGVAKLLPLTDPDQLANTFAGRTLMTFRFLPQN